MNFRPIELRGRPLAQGRLPAVCIPLVGRTREALAAEAQAVAAKSPDLLEWRVDFFDGIADTAAVLETAAAIRAAAPGIPLLFTRRSQREGGQPIALDEAGVVRLYQAVCTGGAADAVDWEMAGDESELATVREAARAAGIALVLSHHNFGLTPAADELAARFAQGHRLGGDVAKLAVMPQSPEDVLTLLQATLDAARTLPIPVVSMSMGGLGALTRVCGGAFGSALTFAVGQAASAPGQLPIDELRAALAALRKAA